MDHGKLYCPDSGPISLCQLIMKLCGGISERNLVLLLMGIEAVSILLKNVSNKRRINTVKMLDGELIVRKSVAVR